MHLTKKNFNWGPALFLIIYHIFLLISLPFYFYYYSPTWQMGLVSFILLYLTGLSITAGYHRFYAHRSYRTNYFVESIILFFGTMGVQGSALRWAFDHRLHHAHVDTDSDPYSIKKGFWYAHFLWMMEKPPVIDPKVVSDLMKNPLVQFQHKHYRYLMLATNLIAFFFAGWLLNDYMGAFFLAVWTRIFFLHHFTWFINSLAHTWGDKPFCQEQSAVNNYIIALLTFGEGYHNFHHTFANDYRNGIRWYHFDPTKWLIWTLNKLGLTDSLKRIDQCTIKKRMVLQRRELLLQRLCNHCIHKKDEWEKKIFELSDRIVNGMTAANQLKEQYKKVQIEGVESEKLEEVKTQMTQLKHSLKEDWRQWVDLSRNILRSKPLENA